MKKSGLRRNWLSPRPPGSSAPEGCFCAGGSAQRFILQLVERSRIGSSELNARLADLGTRLGVCVIELMRLSSQN
jgi:hypothetical protein